MSFNRLRISEDGTFRLRVLRGRTGLTPNILCRVALCLSLREPDVSSQPYDSEGQEINRYTLTGRWDSLYTALLKQKRIQEGIDTDLDYASYFKQHVEQGIILLYNRVKHLEDFVDLLPPQLTHQ
jgi:DNA sulfur modification protein DndE